MLVKYYQFQHPEPLFELFISRMNEMMYGRYASELLNHLLCASDFDMENSVRKAIAVFRLTGIPVQEHIRGIYRSDFNGIRKDWCLSELACSLIILCSDAKGDMINTTKEDLLDVLGL